MEGVENAVSLSSWERECFFEYNTEQCVVAWHAEIWLVAKRIRSSRGIS